MLSEDDDDRAHGAELAGSITSRKYAQKLVPMLIDRLDASKEKNPWASIFAAGSLEALTGQEFGSERRSHKRWHDWWYKQARQKVPKLETSSRRFVEKTQADYHNKQGEIHLAGGNFVKAINLFRRAIKLDGSKALYHSNLGLALLETEEYDLALQRFNDSIAVDKTFIRAYLNKGAVYSERAERYREVAVRMKAAIKAHNREGNKDLEEKVRKHLQEVMKSLHEESEQALKTYRYAIATDKSDRLWAAHHAIGRIYMQRGDFDKAVAPLERARDLRSREIGIRRDLALTYYGLDQYYRSLKEIKAVEGLGGTMDEDFVTKVELRVKAMVEDMK